MCRTWNLPSVQQRFFLRGFRCRSCLYCDQRSISVIRAREKTSGTQGTWNTKMTPEESVTSLDQELRSFRPRMPDYHGHMVRPKAIWQFRPSILHLWIFIQFHIWRPWVLSQKSTHAYNSHDNITWQNPGQNPDQKAGNLHGIGNPGYVFILRRIADQRNSGALLVTQNLLWVCLFEITKLCCSTIKSCRYAITLFRNSEFINRLRERDWVRVPFSNFSFQSPLSSCWF